MADVQLDSAHASNSSATDDVKGDPATLPALVDEMTTSYWNAAEREICNMLLFYREELVKFYPEATPYEQELKDLPMKQFKKLFKLWCTSPNTVAERISSILI